MSIVKVDYGNIEGGSEYSVANALVVEYKYNQAYDFTPPETTNAQYIIMGLNSQPTVGNTINIVNDSQTNIPIVCTFDDSGTFHYIALPWGCSYSNGQIHATGYSPSTAYGYMTLLQIY